MEIKQLTGDAKFAKNSKDYNWPIVGVNILRHGHGAEEGRAGRQQEDDVRPIAAEFEENQEAAGVSRDLHGAVQQEVDHHGAADVAGVEDEAVVDQGDGEPVDVHDEGLLGHVWGAEEI